MNNEELGYRQEVASLRLQNSKLLQENHKLQQENSQIKQNILAIKNRMLDSESLSTHEFEVRRENVSLKQELENLRAILAANQVQRDKTEAENSKIEELQNQVHDSESKIESLMMQIQQLQSIRQEHERNLHEVKRLSSALNESRSDMNKQQRSHDKFKETMLSLIARSKEAICSKSQELIEISATLHLLQQQNDELSLQLNQELGKNDDGLQNLKTRYYQKLKSAKTIFSERIEELEQALKFSETQRLLLNQQLNSISDEPIGLSDKPIRLSDIPVSNINLATLSAKLRALILSTPLRSKQQAVFGQAYTHLCLLMGDMSKVRVFCIDLLRVSSEYPVRVLIGIAQIWPEVFHTVGNCPFFEMLELIMCRLYLDNSDAIHAAQKIADTSSSQKIAGTSSSQKIADTSSSVEEKRSHTHTISSNLDQFQRMYRKLQSEQQSFVTFFSLVSYTPRTSISLVEEQMVFYAHRLIQSLYYSVALQPASQSVSNCVEQFLFPDAVQLSYFSALELLAMFKGWYWTYHYLLIKCVWPILEKLPDYSKQQNYLSVPMIDLFLQELSPAQSVVPSCCPSLSRTLSAAPQPSYSSSIFSCSIFPSLVSTGTASGSTYKQVRQAYSSQTSYACLSHESSSSLVSPCFPSQSSAPTHNSEVLSSHPAPSEPSCSKSFHICTDYCIQTKILSLFLQLIGVLGQTALKYSLSQPSLRSLRNLVGGFLRVSRKSPHQFQYPFNIQSSAVTALFNICGDRIDWLEEVCVWYVNLSPHLFRLLSPSLQQDLNNLYTIKRRKL